MNLFNRRTTTASLLALALTATLLPNAGAATATGNFQVSATVVSACAVSAATLNFGAAIDPTAAALPLDASTTMTVMCTATTPYSVALNAGANAGGASNFGARSIKNGSHTLGYQLYLDGTRSTVWGDGTASSLLPGVGIGSNQTLTIYGRLPSLVGAVPGTYTDTVTVTITY
ncbi:MAG: spore coat U domain-containing protein [Burkholderiaceae bacterium]